MKGNMTMKTETPALWKWYIEKLGDGKLRAHGVVTNHHGIMDSTLIHTSRVMSVKTDIDNDEMVITTKNTVYHCKLSTCRFAKQDGYPDVLENYDCIKERYCIPQAEPEIEQGKVLLVLSDYDEFYFHSLCVKNSTDDLEKYNSNANLGMFQDSYLIYTNDHRIDLRYFPGDRRIEFYSIETNGMPLYIENIGSCSLILQVQNRESYYTLKPGERICFMDQYE